jgi:hypothetical protein
MVVSSAVTVAVLVAVIGVAASGVAVVASTVALRSERGARTVGRWADRLINPLTRRLARGRSVDLTGKLLNFRSSVIGVTQPRCLPVTASTLLLQLTPGRSWSSPCAAWRPGPETSP